MSDPAKVVGGKAWCDEQQRRAKELNLPPAPKPPTEATDAFFGVGTAGLFNFGGSPSRTRDWSVPRHR
jgi:hypothetical protein